MKIFYFCKMKAKLNFEHFRPDLEDYLPSLSVDCVVFGYKNEALYVLLPRWTGSQYWSLPGGFIYKDEDLDNAAARILKDRTGLDNLFLKQLHTFGRTQRRNVKELSKYLDYFDINTTTQKWSRQRFISVAYLAMVNPDTFVPISDSLSDACEWLPLSELPQLVFDHNEIIAKAKEYIKIQIKYEPIGISLLPDKFTMKSLQKLYEVVLERKLDRGNFQKKVLKLGVLNKHEKLITGGAYRSPYLYSFNKEKYQEFLKSGIGFLH